MAESGQCNVYTIRRTEGSSWEVEPNVLETDGQAEPLFEGSWVLDVKTVGLLLSFLYGILIAFIITREVFLLQMANCFPVVLTVNNRPIRGASGYAAELMVQGAIAMLTGIGLARSIGIASTDLLSLLR
jgi:hypothetical protein